MRKANTNGSSRDLSHPQAKALLVQVRETVVPRITEQMSVLSISYEGSLVIGTWRANTWQLLMVLPSGAGCEFLSPLPY